MLRIAKNKKILIFFSKKKKNRFQDKKMKKKKKVYLLTISGLSLIHQNWPIVFHETFEMRFVKILKTPYPKLIFRRVIM